MWLQYLNSITLILLGQECISLVDAFSVASKATSSASSTNANKETPPLLKWLIVGGGPHGVHIATCLLDELAPSISHSNIQIVDDEPQLLHKWKTRTAATGMSYLRSSSSYHLDVREDGLKRFANEHIKTSNSAKRKTSKSSDPLFAADYQRPKLDFFNQHCDHVIAKNRLDKVHLQGRVMDILPKETHVEVEIQQPNGEILTSHAENIVLALGSDVPSYPDWATQDMIDDGKVRHIFADDDSCGDDSFYPRRKSIAIVGGGISAAHLALKLEREQAATSINSCNTEIDDGVQQTNIHILCRHELREKQFDTHQDWMMDSFAAKRSEAGGGQGIPKCQQHFASLESFVDRRNVIKKERQAGTISPSVSRGDGGLRYAIEGERIHWHEGDIRSVTAVESTEQLSISTFADETVLVDEIILATGFGKRPPCADLIQSIATKNDLKLCPCGYPAPDESLRWHKRIFLAGALAELELGPSARNIAGARLTSERIVAAVTMRNVASLTGAVV